MGYLGEIFGIGTSELLIVLAIVLLLFGGKKIPELMKNAGKAVSELRKGISGEEDEKKTRANNETNS